MSYAAISGSSMTSQALSAGSSASKAGGGLLGRVMQGNRMSTLSGGGP